MIHLGRFNTMRILRETPPGLYLDAGEDYDGILLPRRWITPDMTVGDTVEVFLYHDSEGRPIATTDLPHVQVGGFANLAVVSVVDRVGIFLDWGLSKDLLLPFNEHGNRELHIGDRVIVAVFLDDQQRVVAASRQFDRFFPADPPHYQRNDPVDALIYGESPLGYKCIVNQTYSGLLYHADTHAPHGTLAAGDELVAYVKDVYEDGKIDLLRDPAGYGRVESLAEQILQALDDPRHEHTLPLNDKSSPEAIRATFNTSKKAFKQALGQLYKQRHIRFTDNGIERVFDDNSL